MAKWCFRSKFNRFASQFGANNQQHLPVWRFVWAPTQGVSSAALIICLETALHWSVPLVFPKDSFQDPAVLPPAFVASSWAAAKQGKPRRSCFQRFWHVWGGAWWCHRCCHRSRSRSRSSSSSSSSRRRSSRRRSSSSRSRSSRSSSQ